MRFYPSQHKFYGGIDLHARSMYVCIIDQAGEVQFHKNLKTERDEFLKVIEPYREDIVVAVECVFLWYWLADLCAGKTITCVVLTTRETMRKKPGIQWFDGRSAPHPPYITVAVVSTDVFCPSLDPGANWSKTVGLSRAT